MRDLRRWWWVPALGALLCGGVSALLTANWVAGRVEDGAVAALEAAGLDSSVEFVDVNGLNGIGRDGVHVLLEGPAADEASAIEAVSARSEIDEVGYRIVDGDAGSVEATTDEQTEGQLPADGPPAGDARDDDGETAAVPLAAAAAVSADGIVLSGRVPDQSTADAMVAEAVARFGERAVTNELEVAAGVAAGDRVTLTLSGLAPSESERAALVEAGTAVAAAGGLDVVDEITVSAMTQALNELFELEPIEFDSGRSIIREGSMPTLDRAAELINGNPDAGRLLVVGHTDSVGPSGPNQTLSEARASAVVEYLITTGGVDGERLEAEGRGESELLVDPEARSLDRQRNRRIEWELLS